MVKLYAVCAVTIMLIPLRVACDTVDEKAAYEKVTSGIVAYLKGENGRLSDEQMVAIATNVYEASSRYRIDYRLILAVMKVESNFREGAISRKGAVGLLQIKPSVGRSVAKDVGIEWKGKAQLHEPEKNIRIGVFHLAVLINRFVSLQTALSAYNKGQKRVKMRAVGRRRPNIRYASAVMVEYDKTLSLPPGPQAAPNGRSRSFIPVGPMVTENR